MQLFGKPPPAFVQGARDLPGFDARPFDGGPQITVAEPLIFFGRQVRPAMLGRHFVINRYQEQVAVGQCAVKVKNDDCPVVHYIESGASMFKIPSPCLSTPAYFSTKKRRTS